MMNERIQELWEEGTVTVFPRDGDYSSVSAANIKKFVELIVRECADVGERYADGNYEIYNRILEHFGVDD